MPGPETRSAKRGDVRIADQDAGQALLLVLRGTGLPDRVATMPTLEDLGAGLRVEHRGRHALKGVPGEWQLFAVTGASAP